MSNELPSEIVQPQQGFPCMDALVSRQINEIEEILRAFVDSPRTSDLNDMDDALEAHIESVGYTLEELVSGVEDNEDALRQMATYISGLLERCIMMTNGIRESGARNKNGVGISIEAEGSELAEMPEIVSAMIDMYEATLRGYLDNWCGVVEDEYVDKDAQRREQLRMLGRQCLDVAKIGLGVVGGVAVAKKLRLIS